MVPFKFFLISLAAIILSNFSVSDAYGNKVIMEYIGATGVPIAFTDVPINPDIDFYFILGFAIDSNPSGVSQNGIFSPYWIPSITPSSVASIKSTHPNVKVLVSLSGWSIGDKVLHWYNPRKPDVWVSNAVKSLTNIIKNYHLNGIDIDYEVFPQNDTTFTYCIGQLITKLKMKNVITVASIAPYFLTTKFYIPLYRSYPSVIDFVNHQFYTDRVNSPRAFVNAFKLRATQFLATKLLPSYEVDGRGIQGDGFFEALSMLETSGFEVNGVMIFSADGSKKNKFYYEKKSQDFLLNNNSTT